MKMFIDKNKQLKSQSFGSDRIGSDRNGTADYASFTKEFTQIVRGAAILLMVYHHLFVIPERINNDYINLLLFGSFDLQSYLACYAKICVGIYCFLSGLGIYYTLNAGDFTLRHQYRLIFKKIVLFIIQYNVIYLIFVTIGCAMGSFRFDWHYVTGIFAFEPTYYNGELWFVTTYLFLILSAPILNYFFDRRKRLLYRILLICIPVVVYGLYAGLSIICPENILQYILSIVCGTSLSLLVPCVIIFIEGFLCSKYDIYTRIIKVLSGNGHLKIKLTIILLFSILLRILLVQHETTMRWDFIAVPLFVTSIAPLIYNTKATKLFKFFGKHSTNIWMLHTYWCYYLFQKVVLLPEISVLIYVWLLILSSASSFAINLIYKPISEKVVKLIDQRC